MPHIERVRGVFEDPDRYLNGSRYNIRIRSETVKEFVRSRHFKRILDIGCGDGSLSLPLLSEHNQLTALDVSTAMLAAARNEVPVELMRNVEFVNEDFLTAPLAGQYDLILCVGVLAHVSSPTRAIAKIASLLEQDGCVIAQITDYRHLVSWMTRACRKAKELFTPAPYALNLLSGQEVIEMFARQRMDLIDLYRYSSPLPGMGHVLSESALYHLIRLLNGRYPRTRNPGLGNEFLCHFQRSTMNRLPNVAIRCLEH